MVKQQGVDGIQRAFLSYDVDGSGQGSTNQNTDGQLTIRMVSRPSGQWSPFIGSITREELKEWMTRHGRFLTRRQVAMMIDAVDINDDGEIDYSEFLVSLTTFLLKSIRWAVHL